jgi:hypothetical protein
LQDSSPPLVEVTSPVLPESPPEPEVAFESEVGLAYASPVSPDVPVALAFESRVSPDFASPMAIASASPVSPDTVFEKTSPVSPELAVFSRSSLQQRSKPPKRDRLVKLFHGSHWHDFWSFPSIFASPESPDRVRDAAVESPEYASAEGLAVASPESPVSPE